MAALSKVFCLAATLVTIVCVIPAFAQTNWQTEWVQRQEAAKKEGKVVFSIPPSTELRKALESAVKKKFGFEIEVVPGTAAKIIRRIADEQQAGVRYFDAIISTFDNLEHSLIPAGAVEPIESLWILPEVKDAKNWWGGYIWTDNAKKFAYSPFAYMQDNLWYNTDQVKPDEIRVYDDLLKPKWKGKIGLWDPRQGGASGGKWAFLWANKGEAYLKKLVEQISFIAADRRQVADSLAKGSIAISIGPTYYSFVSYVKSGLPVKPLPPMAAPSRSKMRRTQTRRKFSSIGCSARKARRSIRWPKAKPGDVSTSTRKPWRSSASAPPRITYRLMNSASTKIRLKTKSKPCAARRRSSQKRFCREFYSV
jgi:hypothetical protein